MYNKTIAAISTPSGEGGIGVIRISGKEATKVADKVFFSNSGKKVSELRGYTALYGDVVFGSKKIDEAVALYFKAPKSYTGEDVVEISVHGGMYVMRETLRAILSSGAVEAKAGEFTMRAFQNGKLDLIEAESVMGLISAHGEKAHRAAMSLHDGVLSRKINKIKDGLITAAAGLAVYSDYPDDELPEFSEETLLTSLGVAKDGLEELLKNFDFGKILREGVDCVIAGRPNVGKSTLMNLLCRTRRSIVTSVEGTTRDVVEETVTLGDVRLRLSDTAGLRDTNDTVEKIGVDISREKITTAGLIIAVFDGSREADREDKKLIEICKSRPSVVVINKTDLENRLDKGLFSGMKVVEICAEDENSLQCLEPVISQACKLNQLDGNEVFLCSERQRQAAENSLKSVNEAIELMHSNMTLDAVGIVIDDAIAHILTLTGERVTEAVVNEVFSKFCVGK